jgi:hypothetical protein
MEVPSDVSHIIATYLIPQTKRIANNIDINELNLNMLLKNPQIIEDCPLDNYITSIIDSFINEFDIDTNQNTNKKNNILEPNPRNQKYKKNLENMHDEDFHIVSNIYKNTNIDRNKIIKEENKLKANKKIYYRYINNNNITPKTYLSILFNELDDTDIMLFMADEMNYTKALQTTRIQQSLVGNISELLSYTDGIRNDIYRTAYANKYRDANKYIEKNNFIYSPDVYDEVYDKNDIRNQINISNLLIECKTFNMNKCKYNNMKQKMYGRYVSQKLYNAMKYSDYVKINEEYETIDYLYPNISQLKKYIIDFTKFCEEIIPTIETYNKCISKMSDTTTLIKLCAENDNANDLRNNSFICEKYFTKLKKDKIEEFGKHSIIVDNINMFFKSYNIDIGINILEYKKYEIDKYITILQEADNDIYEFQNQIKLKTYSRTVHNYQSYNED